MRIEKKDLGHTPPTIHMIRCQMLGRQRRIYERLESEMWAELTPKQRVTTGLKITQMAKLQQISSGWVIDDDDEITDLGRAKLRKVRSLLRKLDGPTVIFCRYKYDIAQMVEAAHEFTDKVGIIYGKVKQVVREKIQADFQAGKIDVLICQIKTGGVGLDLYKGRYGIIYSSTFSFIDFDQAIARLDIIGQTDVVEIFFLIVDNTIDEDIATALTSKRSISDITLSRLKKGKHYEG